MKKTKTESKVKSDTKNQVKANDKTTKKTGLNENKKNQTNIKDNQISSFKSQSDINLYLEFLDKYSNKKFDEAIEILEKIKLKEPNNKLLFEFGSLIKEYKLKTEHENENEEDNLPEYLKINENGEYFIESDPEEN